MGVNPQNQPPEVIKERLKRETAMWAKVVKASGAKLE
jgi:hypothetical protein